MFGSNDNVTSPCGRAVSLEFVFLADLILDVSTVYGFVFNYFLMLPGRCTLTKPKYVER